MLLPNRSATYSNGLCTHSHPIQMQKYRWFFRLRRSFPSDRLQRCHYDDGQLPSELKQCIGLWRLVWSFGHGSIHTYPAMSAKMHERTPTLSADFSHLITLTSAQAVPLRQNLGIGRGELESSRVGGKYKRGDLWRRRLEILRKRARYGLSNQTAFRYEGTGLLMTKQCDKAVRWAVTSSVLRQRMPAG